MKILDMICEAEWIDDCFGKQDLDFPLLECSTRYYPDFTASPSFLCCTYKDGNKWDFIRILGLHRHEYITGICEEDCKMKVKQWYKDNLVKAIKKFLRIVKGECYE